MLIFLPQQVKIRENTSISEKVNALELRKSKITPEIC